MAISPAHHLFNIKVDIERSTSVQDEYTTPTTTWAVEHSDLEVMIQPISGDELLRLGKDLQEVSHIMFTDPIDITAQDRVKYGDRYYNILHAGNAIEMDHHLEVLLRELANTEVV